MWRIFSKIAGIVAYVCLQAVVNSISPHSPKQAQVTGMHSVAAPHGINASPLVLPVVVTTSSIVPGQEKPALILSFQAHHTLSTSRSLTSESASLSLTWYCLNPSRPPLSEKAMAPHSSTFAWKIPWTKEPGRLQSVGSLELGTTERLHFHFSLSCIGEGNGNPLQCSCLENPRDVEAWWAAVYGVAQSRTWLKRLSSSSSRPPLGLPWCSDSKESTCNVGEPGWIPGSGRSPLEEGMATHSSILAWEIPWTEESGGLQAMGSQRVRHNWETNTSTTTGYRYVYKIDSSCTHYPLIFFFPVPFLWHKEY